MSVRSNEWVGNKFGHPTKKPRTRVRGPGVVALVVCVGCWFGEERRLVAIEMDRSLVPARGCRSAANQGAGNAEHLGLILRVGEPQNAAIAQREPIARDEPDAALIRVAGVEH